MKSAADRNLLFGILALQLDFISRDALVSAMNAWVLEKHRSIGEILQSQGQLSAERLKLLDSLVAEHIRQHGGNAEASLQALSSIDAVRKTLMQVCDPDVEASLALIPAMKSKPELDSTYIPPSSSATRFRILRPHAKGGLGQVSVALDGELNREVAFKELQEYHADNQDSRSRFVLEAEVTGGLEHPGIVPVYGLGQYADGRPYYAMRFIKGDSLKEAIEAFHCTHHAPRDAVTAAPEPDSPHRDAQNATRTAQGVTLAEREKYNSLAFRKLLGRFIDVCQAISYAHSRGVLHRDLKPGNIMLGKYGETLVVDWGLAKLKGRSETHSSDERTLQPSGSGVTPTVVGHAIGTPAYMSPEQAAGRLDELGPPTDVYSLGATLFHLLTGEAPFRGDHAAVLRNVQAGRVPRPASVQPAVPKALEAVCLKAMSLQPGDRYDSPQQLASEIEHFLADEPVSALGEPLTVRTRRWVRKHQTLAVTTAAVLLLSAIGLGVFSTVVAGKNSELLAANIREREARTAAESAQKLAETNAKSAREQSQLALSTLTSVVNDIQGGLRDLPGGSEVRRRLLTTSLEKLESVSTTFLSQTTVDHQTWRALMDMGDVIKDFGVDSLDRNNPAAKPSSKAPSLTEQESALLLAKSYYSRALVIARSMSKADDASDPSTLPLSYEKLAGVAQTQGNLEEAARLFEEALRVRQRPGESDPANPAWQRDLMWTLINLGDLARIKGIWPESQRLYGEALSIAQRVATSEPGNTDRQYDLAVANERLGLLAMAQRQLDDAKRYHSARHMIIQRLADSNPEDIYWQRDLSISLSEMGDLAMTQGDLPEAQRLFNEAFLIRQRLVESDPANTERQRVLSEVFEKLGNLALAQRDFPEASTQFNKSLAIRQRLAESDADNGSVQNELAWTLKELGELAQTQGDLPEASRLFGESLEIRQRLAESDAGNPTTQHELAWTLEKLGDISNGMQNGIQSQKLFGELLPILQRLAESEPANANWQRAIANCHCRIGHSMIIEERYSAAVDCYEKGVAILHQMIEEGMDVEASKRDVQFWKNRVEMVRFTEAALGDWDSLLQKPANELPKYLDVRCYHCCKSKRHVRLSDAEQAATKLCELANADDGQLYNAACVFSLCATAIKAAEGAELSAEESARRRELLTKSVAALKQSIDKGWTDFAHMQQDPDLTPLRELSEFKALIPAATETTASKPDEQATEQPSPKGNP